MIDCALKGAIAVASRAVGLAALVALGLTCAGGLADGARAHGRHQHAHEAKSHEIVTQSRASYAIPHLTLTRHDGVAVDIADELSAPSPVYFNFIYTSCTTVCPLMSQTFAALQEELGDRAASVNMISVSIDPEHDTPARLAEYARLIEARPNWRFYTGSVEASINLQKAFGSFAPDKMGHRASTFFRARPGEPWVRVDGFASPADLAKLMRRGP